LLLYYYIHIIVAFKVFIFIRLYRLISPEYNKTIRVFEFLPFIDSILYCVLLLFIFCYLRYINNYILL